MSRRLHTFKKRSRQIQQVEREPIAAADLVQRTTQRVLPRILLGQAVPSYAVHRVSARSA
jgi:hypothetical protein